ncbi:MAG: acylneuraminate cytidylyltransferase family protein [Bacteroidia bacterium]|nr:acylneuraminate cytidylyltransferase family protein [Bacteroidia bacterium]
MKVVCFLPCRAGSERVKNKNTRQFAGVEGGLLEIKLDQLCRCNIIDKIVLSTDDQKVIDISKQFGSRIRIDNRPPELASSDASTDDLIRYTGKIISDPHILWTHVTSPFTGEEVYNRAINDYFKFIKTGKYDSLMSVTPIRVHVWNKKGEPVNYKRGEVRWPRSQQVDPMFEVNSAIFINSRENYIRLEDRIGLHPFLFEMDRTESIDIDYEDDFLLAESIYRFKQFR